MTTFNPSDRTCFPADDAPAVTNKIAICQVCGVQWQVKSPSLDDAKGCSFCDAPEDAIAVVSEKPTFGPAMVYGGK